ncbi:hypothetical protein E2562_007704 [Oryza meyeriana var. granulata]|uniref:Uncharacterized protein n=1 Tax=Oryza meyeriana var. granulata TaxID=110450 RepID=A0A6G1EFI6_9ORYZ|nr:hypothetical protein E2562_007704 [Oryza meyeriana var. granulata]
MFMWIDGLGLTRDNSTAEGGRVTVRGAYLSVTRVLPSGPTCHTGERVAKLCIAPMVHHWRTGQGREAWTCGMSRTTATTKHGAGVEVPMAAWDGEERPKAVS